MATFSERIKELRESRNLTQDALGAVIGVKRFSIYSYEKGRAYPEMKGLIALADYFDVSMDYLAGRTDNPAVNRSHALSFPLCLFPRIFVGADVLIGPPEQILNR